MLQYVVPKVFSDPVLHHSPESAQLPADLLRRDRHENIGRGELGTGFFTVLMNDPRLDGVPLIMETPAQCTHPRHLRIMQVLVL